MASPDLPSSHCLQTLKAGSASTGGWRGRPQPCGMEAGKEGKALESQSGSSPLQASKTPTATTCPAFGASLPSSGPSCSASTLTATGLTLPTSASSAISDPGGEISAPWGPQDLDSASETSGGTVPPLGYPSTVAGNTQQEDFGLPGHCPRPLWGRPGGGGKGSCSVAPR